MSVPRLGAASLIIEFGDAEGFKVTHGTAGAVLAYKPPDDCEPDDWDALWRALDGIGVRRGAGQ